MADAIFGFEAHSSAAVDKFVADLQRALAAIDQAAAASGKTIAPEFKAGAIEQATNAVIRLRTEIERLMAAYGRGQLAGKPIEAIQEAVRRTETALGQQMGRFAGRFGADVRPAVAQLGDAMHQALTGQAQTAMREAAQGMRGSRGGWARRYAGQEWPATTVPGEIFRVPLEADLLRRTQMGLPGAAGRLEQVQQEAQAIEATRERQRLQRMEAEGRTRTYGRAGEFTAVQDPQMGLRYYETVLGGERQLIESKTRRLSAERALIRLQEQEIAGAERVMEANRKAAAAEAMKGRQLEAQRIDAAREREYLQRMQAEGRTRTFGRDETMAVADPRVGLRYYEMTEAGERRLIEDKTKRARVEKELAGIQEKEIEGTEQAMRANRTRAYLDRLDREGRAVSFGRGEKMAVEDPQKGLQYYQMAADASWQLVTAGRDRLRLARQMNAELDKQVTSLGKQIQIVNAQPRNFFEGFVGGLTSRGFRAGMGLSALRDREGRNQMLTDLGTTAGNVAKYSGLYSILNNIQQAIGDTIAQALDFADSFADLDVAMGGTVEVSERYVNALTDIATLSGANVGAALDAAARGIRAFGDSATMTVGEIENVGAAVANTSTQLALIAGKELKDATGDVIAIGTAFNLTGNQLNLVTDSIGSAKQKFGGDPKQIAQGLANISITAREAGYEVSEAADMISLVVARTDQSGQAAATRLSRIFSIISGTTGQSLGRQLGIDTTASIKDQLQDIARIYEDAGPELQGRIRSALGGTANMRELLPLLDPESQRRMQEAFTPGKGADEFQRKLDTLVGTFKLIQGHIKAIQVGLVRADIFAPLGAAVRAAEPGLRTIADLLNLYARLPDPIKTATAALIQFSLALKAIQVMRGGAGVGGLLDIIAPREGGTPKATKPGMATRIRGALPGGGADPFTSAAIERYVASINTGTAQIVAANEARAAAEGRLIATIGGTAPVRAVAETGEALAETAPGPLGPRKLRGAAGYREMFANMWRSPFFRIGAGIGVLGGAAVGIDTFARGAQQVRGAEGASARMVSDLAREDLAGSASSLRNAADSLRASAHELDRQQKGLVGFAFSGPRRGTMAGIEDQARIFEEQARAIETERTLAAARRDTSVFGDAATRSIESLSAGLRTLAVDGASASEQARRYVEALTEVPEGFAGVSLLPEQTTSRLAAAFADATREGDLFATSVDGIADAAARGAGAPMLGDQFIEEAFATGREIKPEEYTKLQDTIRERIRSFELAPGEALDEQQRNQLTDTIVRALGVENLDELTARQRAEILEKARLIVDRTLSGAGKSGILPTSILEDPGQLERWIFGDESDPKNKVAGSREVFQSWLTKIPAGDVGIERAGVLGQVVTALDEARTRLRRNMQRTREGTEEYAKAERGYLEVSAQYAEFARQRAENASQLERRRGARRLFTGALPGRPRATRTEIQRYNLAGELVQGEGQTDLLIEAMERYDQVTVSAVVGSQKRAIAIKLKKVRNDLRIAKLAGAYLPGFLRERLNLPDLAATTELEKKLTAALNALTEAEGLATPGAAEDVMSSAARRAAEARIAATRSGDAAAAAKAAVDTAKADLAKTKADKNASEDSVFAAREAVAQAERSQADLLRERAGMWSKIRVMRRGGDEVALARDALRTARAARAAAPNDPQRVLAVLEAQQAVADAEVARQTAQIQLRVARVGGSLTEAKGAIDIANIQIRAAAGRGTATAQALLALAQGQEQMRAAMLDYAANLDLLRGDVTDPVEQARDALADARRRLRSARNRGRGQDEIAALEVQERQAAANLWRTQFNERLNDARTRYELGQLSFDAYMRYLSAEKRRLLAIRRRTYDQQQALYQIEREMQGLAKALEGQWNLGDIKLPTVYQVRRAIAGGDGANMPGQIETVPYRVTVDVTPRAAQLLQIVGGAPTVYSTHLRKV